MTNDERMQRESYLIATLRKTLPEFAKACADEAELVLLHQDAFAADYQEESTDSSVYRRDIARFARCSQVEEVFMSQHPVR